jgi:hypothetical protein
MVPRFLLSGAALLVASCAVSTALAGEAPPLAPPPSPTTAAAEPTDATLLLEIDELDAHVFLDGVPVDVPAVRGRCVVTPGHHVIEARKEGWPPQRSVIDVRAGETTGVVLRLVPLSAEAIGYDETVTDAKRTANTDPYRLPLLLTGAALSVAGLGIGVGLNLAANGKEDDAHADQTAIARSGGTTSSCYSPTPAAAPTCAALHDALTARDGYANVSVGAYIAGGAFAAATFAYLIWPAVAPAFGPEKHHLYFEAIRAVPTVGPGTGGVALMGAF